MIVFVPGIKGSELYEGNNKRWFPSTKQDVELLNIKNELDPSFLLRHVTPFGLTKMTQIIYRGLQDEFDEESLAPFPYDWRRSIFDHVQQLTEKIITESKATGEKITLVGHSMGGLLCKLAIQKLEEIGELSRLNKLITIGTPWHGAPDAFKALLYGEPGAFEKLKAFIQILTVKGTKKLARMLPSAYQLLPSEAYFNHKEGDFIITDNGNKITYESFKTIIQNIHDEDKEEVDHLDVWKEYIEPLHTVMNKNLPDGVIHDCLIGHSIPTLYKVPLNSNVGIVYKKYKQPSSFMNGDGVVPIHSAIPSHNANLFFTEGQHASLCSLPKVLEFIKWSVSNQSINNLPSEIIKSNDELPVNTQLKAGFLARVMCPVDSTILDEHGKYVAGVFDTSITEISELAESDSVTFYNVGEAKYIFFNEEKDQDLTFEIHAYENGIASVSLEEYKEEGKTELKFETIPISNEKSAKLIIPANKPIEKSILKYEGENKTPKPLLKMDEKDISKTPIPKIKINFEGIEGVKKVPHRHTYSGPIYLKVESEEFEKIDELFFTIDQKSIDKYNEKTMLELESGQHIIEVFGKDIYNRSIYPAEMKINIDNTPPKTILNLIVDPEGIFVTFKAKSNNSPVETFYRFIVEDKIDLDQEWRKTEVDNKIKVPSGKLTQNRNASIKIEFFSKNKAFDLEENLNTLKFGLGEIPILMWKEITSAVTPIMIWESLFQNNLFEIDDFSVTQFIQNKYYNIGKTDIIGDNVKSIKFESVQLNIEVFFSEKYSLYFSGPPTELLQLGQQYEFSFELRTERTNENITTTSPVAKLHPIQAKKLSDKIINLKEEKNGVFKGKFTVDSNFKHFKHKLIITDMKNISPPLREIPLILNEDDE